MPFYSQAAYCLLFTADCRPSMPSVNFLLSPSEKSMHKIHRSSWLLALLFYGIYFILMPARGCDYDMQCWAQWASYIFEHGLGHAYGSGTNYGPGHLYELKLYTLLFHSPQEVTDHIYYLKYFTLLFDIAGALLVCSLFATRSAQAGILLAFMLNPAYLHNNVIWGQFDSVFSTLAFAAFLAAYQKRFLLSVTLYLISLNFKLQAILFFPALTLLLLYRSELKIEWKKIARGALVLVLVEGIIVLPFILQSQGMRLWHTASGVGGSYNFVALNASTVWHLILEGGDLRWMPDRIEYFGIPLKAWGLLLAAGSFFLVLLPLIAALIKLLRKKPAALSFNRLLVLFALSVLVFFYFNTQMHERYTFPAFLFIASFSFLAKRWWIYVLFSAAYFLNNEKALSYFRQFDHELWIFDYWIASALYLAVILALAFYHAGGYKFRFKTGNKVIRLIHLSGNSKT